MVGVDVSVHAPPSARGPLRGPQGEPGPRGETGPPGDPVELLAPLSPGDALSVDDAGRPAPLAVVGKLPPGSGNRIVVTNSAGIEVPYAVTQMAATSHAIVQRTATGQAVVADAATANEASTLGQVRKPSTYGMTQPTGDYVLMKKAGADEWASRGLASTALASSIASRTSTGTIKAADAVAADDAVTKAQLDGKVTAITTSGTVRVYTIEANGSPSARSIATQPNVSTLVARDANGRAQVEDPAAGKDIASKQYVDAALSPAQRAAINALPTTGATVDQIVAALKAS